VLLPGLAWAAKHTMVSLRAAVAESKKREMIGSTHSMFGHDGLDLLERQEGEELEVAADVGIRRPVEELGRASPTDGKLLAASTSCSATADSHLVEVKKARQAFVQPNGVARALAKLLAARRRQERDRQPECALLPSRLRRLLALLAGK
jgi:hypothetical protein